MPLYLILAVMVLHYEPPCNGIAISCTSSCTSVTDKYSTDKEMNKYTVISKLQDYLPCAKPPSCVNYKTVQFSEFGRISEVH